MLIFVPMAGTGDRYLRAGYTQAKPLICVDGAPMIERVIETFPKDAKYLFGVNRAHAEKTGVLATIERLRPGSRVVVMDPHKDGPVETLLRCADALPDDDDVLLNYCDFGVDWSFAKFAAWLVRGGWDCAMTGYKGFHPHSLGPTLYAYMRNEGDRVLEIREKHYFTANKFDEYASSGLYWFKSGRDMKHRARALVASGQRVNNEFYASMLVQSFVESGAKVGVYPLKHFYQWGTPEDLRDYESWAKTMRTLDSFLDRVARTRSRSALVLPAAGRGQRFADRGYADPKPLIDTCGRPMLAQSLAFLPQPANTSLVVRKSFAQNPRIRALADAQGARVIALDRVTEGQACSAALGATHLSDDAPVLFAPCDTGYVYDTAAWTSLETRDDIDLVVFTARAHLPAIWRPKMYGWLRVDPDMTAREVRVKNPLPDLALAEQDVVTGTFWFRQAGRFRRELANMEADDDRVNGEFYIDTIARRMVERGARVVALRVDKYIPWGTPEELDTFGYWNDVFRDGRPVGIP